MTHSHIFNRRTALARTGGGIGLAALASLVGNVPSAEAASSFRLRPRAKRVIYLQQSGAPSQLDLFDPKPQLQKLHGEEIPESVTMGQRLTTMTSSQSSRPVTASMFKFAQHGESGATISELLPHTAKVADDLCIIRSLNTDAINHDPAITFMQTGSERPGRPSLGAWVSYGLGSENSELPAFIVLVSGGQTGDQPLFGRLWGNGFLPADFQGVKFRGGRDPVLYLQDPVGMSRTMRHRMMDAQAELNALQMNRVGDPQIEARITQFERAFQMQESVPKIANINDEPEATFRLYGDDAKTPGTFAANCLLARRLVENDVRFVQLYHRGWDHHENLPRRIRTKCRQTDQASAALVQDLKQRGLLEDTLIVWAGEFGRTAYCQGKLTADDYGRDHHPRCFSIWMAGGGVKPGLTYGSTDDFSYNVDENPVHVHDLNATILHCLGIQHTKLTFRHQGRDHRLTDVHGNVVHDVLSTPT